MCRKTRDKVVEIVLCSRLHLSSGKRRGIQILHGKLAWTHILKLTLALCLLHVLNLTCHLLVHIGKGGADEVLGVRLFAHHTVETGKCLEHRHCDIRRALHALPPGKGAVGVLQTRQTGEIVGKTVAYLRLVEIAHQLLLLLRLAVGIKQPRCLGKHNLLQTLVLLQRTLQG